MKGWGPDRVIGTKSEWYRVDERRGMAHEMMLNTDICMAFGEFADKAESQSCCAWVMPSVFNNVDTVIAKQQAQTATFWNHPGYCGFPLDTIEGMDWKPNEAIIKHWCCKKNDDPFPGDAQIPTSEIRSAPKDTEGHAPDCGSPSELTGFAAKHIIEFAEDEAAWLLAFADAWKKATERGDLGGGAGGGGTCFPGHSHVHADGLGELPLQSLRPESAVLVDGADQYEPVIGYLHMPSLELAGVDSILGLVGSRSM